MIIILTYEVGRIGYDFQEACQQYDFCEPYFSNGLCPIIARRVHSRWTQLAYHLKTDTDEGSPVHPVCDACIYELKLVAEDGDIGLYMSTMHGTA